MSLDELDVAPAPSRAEAPRDPLAADHLVLITPEEPWRLLDLRELWRYRELLATLVQRDLTVRYKQTALGVLWAVLQPLVLMIVLSLAFGRVAALAPGEGVPYALFAFAGLLPWQMFARALGDSSLSLTNNTNLVTKVYFPRILLPISPIITSLIDLAIGMVLLAGVMAWFGVVPGWPVALLPLFVLLAVGTSLAVGLWLSALNAVYRDVRHIIPFLTQVWLLLSPVIYPITLVPEQWRGAYGVNPMATVIQGFRWTLLGLPPPPAQMLVTSLVTVAILLIGGLINFRRMEGRFADVV